MITLLASLGGFFSSAFPDLIKYFLDKNDKKHELEVMKIQIKLKEKGIEGRLEEIEGLRNISESRSLYTTYKIGIGWVDALNGTVRPVLAYSFFILYSISKYLQFLSIQGSADISMYVEVLWNVDDQAIFAGIISFYYGQRAILKMRRK